MDMIKGSILTGCIVGIISTFAEISAPEGTLKKQLKLILSLVLVIAVITPFLGKDFKLSFHDYQENYNMKEYDFSSQINDKMIEIANEKVSNYFMEKFSKNGLHIKNTIIYSKLNEYNEIEITKVMVSANTESDGIEAEKLIKEDLKDAEVVIGEGENETVLH